MILTRTMVRKMTYSYVLHGIGREARMLFMRAPLAMIPLLAAGCIGVGDGDRSGTVGESGASAESRSTPAAEVDEGATTTAFSYAGPVLDLPPEPGDDSVPRHETERDWAIAAGMVTWARDQALGTLPVGELVAIIGTTFVGTPYEPGTLELPGQERLVVNLRTFDCVTFVEQVLVLAHLVRDETVVPDADPESGRAFRDRYRELLTELRYRDGRIDGYGSRLHYFTEWMNQAASAGWGADVTEELGGEADPRPIRFMSSNTHAYRQLGEDPALVAGIRAVEARLSEATRLFVPEARIAAVESGIRNGDIIAAVSTVDGLDIAHTGVALRHDGRIHLLHAPLVGDSVEISSRPLADRIRSISGQKGIRVLRPLDR
ncbi:MAG: DUF1460 domain-containing protein [Gemmatimonadales bacterium]|nr:MAG: DUF1460 domain-containing protein [Gemmatimonadales bacterium]